MKSKRALFVTVATLVMLAMVAAPIVARQSKDVLTAGKYSAKVKAIVCSGCGTLIKQTLQKMKAIDAVTVDQEKKTVQFSVKKDGSVKVADLQKALKAASDQMGMGADYTLSDLQPVK